MGKTKFQPSWVNKFWSVAPLKRDASKAYYNIFVRKVSGLMGLESHKCPFITSLTVLKMVDKTQTKNQLFIPINEFSSQAYMERLA